MNNIKYIILKGDNNSEWYCDNSFAILKLTPENIEEIKSLQNKLKEHFNNYQVNIKLYNLYFTWYSVEEDNLLDSVSSEKIVEWFESEQNPKLIDLTENDLSLLIPSNSEPLDFNTAVILKDSMYLKTDFKYDSEELFTEEFDLIALLNKQ